MLCIYLNKDGTLGIGALKHSAVFVSGFEPHVSPLYKATVTKEVLPDSEKVLYDISKEIIRVAEATYNPNDEWCPFVYRLTDDLLMKTSEPEEFLNLIRNITKNQKHH